jgi:Pyruvate/2-oxoacid:ferredoxin oxidoreductase gamma subunit
VFLGVRVSLLGSLEKSLHHFPLEPTCKNFFAMGFVYWLYNRDLQPTLDFIQAKFGGMPDIAEANEKSLKAGFNYGETTEAAIKPSLE